MSSPVLTFASNRGGVGKSTLVCQLAAAIAKQNLLKTVVVIDFSLQNDATVFFLGGTAEPRLHAPGVRTRGAENAANLSSTKSARGFVESAIAAAAPPVPARGFWSSKPSVAPHCDWHNHAVSPNEMNPDGACPSNLFIVPNGRSLADETLDLAVAVPALKNALRGDDVLFVIDTDAELLERPASMVGLACSSHVCLVTTDAWSDYLRLLEDPKNSVMKTLLKLEELGVGAPRIHQIIFNGCNKHRNAFSSLLGFDNALPFTPSSLPRTAVSEIVAHFHDVVNDGSNILTRFFADPNAASGNTVAFVCRYVTGVFDMPDSVRHSSLQNGRPIVVEPWKDDTHTTCALVLETVATKLTS